VDKTNTDALRYILNKYHCDYAKNKVHFSKAFSKYLTKIRLDTRYYAFSLFLEKPKTGNVKIGYPGRNELGTHISRADLADFMLKQVTDTKYIRQAPIITN